MGSIKYTQGGKMYVTDLKAVKRRYHPPLLLQLLGLVYRVVLYGAALFIIIYVLPW
jgi:hypothetical protein